MLLITRVFLRNVAMDFSVISLGLFSLKNFIDDKSHGVG